MTPIAAAFDEPASFLIRLIDPAARALALAGAVGFGLAALRVKNTSVRLFSWTVVLYAALAMPLLGWMLPALPVSLPSLPLAPPSGFATTSRIATPQVSEKIAQSARSVYTGHAQATTDRTFIPRNVAAEHRSTFKDSSAGSRSSTVTIVALTANAADAHQIPWLAIAVSAYLLIAASLILRLVVGLVLAGRLLRSAEDIRDLQAITTLSRLARAAKLRALPRFAESEAISVPVTLGVRKASILLPADWRAWDDAKLGAVLAHELSHVARRDALTQRVSRIHRAIFWFSPLAWWLDHKLTDLAEEASDEAALSGGADRADYAKTLLGFFEALQAAPGRVWWQGVAMAKAGQAERRVDRILAWKGAVSMGLRKSIVVLLVALSVPVLYLTAGVRPSISPQQETVPPPAQAPAQPAPHARPAPAPAPTTAAAPAPAASSTPASNATSAPTIAPAVPVAPIPLPAGIAPISSITPHPSYAWPVPFAGAPRTITPAPGTEPRGGAYGGITGGVPGGVIAPTPLAWGYGNAFGRLAQAGSSTSSTGKDYGYAYGYDDDGQRYVIVSGNSDSVTMSGDDEDARHARALRKKIPGDFIWFERDEKSYIIRDQATIDRARALFKPQEELGKQQEELGKQQEALGDQQEALGKKMEEVRVKVPDMSAEMDKLKAELKKLAEGGTQEELGNLQSEIGELQSKIGELQSHAGDEQGKLGEQMGELGRKQGELGEQQGKLGRKQGELGREAAIEMRHLLDDAITKGTAQPE